ncbi:MAG: MolR family transcriptional regulator [Hymenobacter sp.]|nr:MAG: MolR family transcriptional regulator [Hymenobacter sp.]
MDLYYFDDPEKGLARATSHPFFVEHATADFYYDGGDEFAPFGNDTGYDLLRDLEEWYQERGANTKVAVWLRQLIIAWGFNPAYLHYNTQAQLETVNPEEQYLNDVLDKAVIATILGQCKIAGKADKAMQEMVANAFMRQRYMTALANAPDDPWEEAEFYLSRLAIVEADLAAMATKKAR